MNIAFEQDITFDTAKTGIKGLCALIYSMSETILKDSSPEDINWDECLEARFFNENEEYHFIKDGEEWNVVHITENNDDSELECIDRMYILSGYGKGSLFVREYLEADEDGQVCVKLTRLTGIKRG